MDARSVILAVLLSLRAVSSHAEVFVEASETVVSEQASVAAGQSAWYTLTLEANTALNVKLQVSGGIDNALKTWLLDLPNFQLFKAGQQFNHWPAASPLVTQQGAFTFTVPTTNVYYLVLDNRQSFTQRNVAVRVDRSTGTPNEYWQQQHKAYTSHYVALKEAFDFKDFDIHIQSCGTVNAFSTPDIVMCTELIEEAERRRVPAAETFVFYHEVAHSLLNVWHFPLYDNEDAADEFATVMLMIQGQQMAALQAAQWWEEQSSTHEAKAKLLADDRHSLSAQRARNIVTWLNKKEELLSRWLRVMIPNMTTNTLESMHEGGEKSLAKDVTAAQTLEAVKAELVKREQLSATR